MGVTGLHHNKNFKDIVETYCFMEKELKDKKD
jgi:predicted metal-dependent hydrolase